MRAIPGRLAWLAATAMAIVASFIAVQPANAGAADQCNGAAELCAKPFDQVVLPGTHNSMSALDLGWAIPNQLISIPKQLDAGIRALLIDTHYGKPGPNGTVVNASRAESDGMYLCHELCQIGASPLVPELVKVRDFLAANPTEALVFIVQPGAVTPDDFAGAVTESGLIDYLYTGDPANDPWPTLGTMIDDNERVVLFSEGSTGSVPWYHNAYSGSMQETDYDWRQGGTTQDGIDRLTTTDPEALEQTCLPNRGGTTGSLFLMNHWVNGTLDNSNPVAPDPAVAKIVNAKDVLVARARACEQVRGILPTIIAVDDFGEGDLLGAVRELNGLPPLPDPPGPPGPPDPVPPVPDIPQIRLTVKAPKQATVRAGRRALVKVAVANVGDGPGAVKVCATVPKRLAQKPKCAFAQLAAGGSAKPAVKIQTRRRAKGTGKVTFTVTTANETLTAKTTLKVKPAKKKKSKKRR